jgi:TraX protein
MRFLPKQRGNEALSTLTRARIQARPVTSTDGWKLAGLVFVLVDHYGIFFDEDQDWWRVFGRAAAPIFFFFIGFARTGRVPWSWLGLGLGLTAIDTWTSEESLGRINLNVLINFAYVRLILPEVERRIMPSSFRVALLTTAIVLLIRPFQQIMEYGAEGWLWALFGLAHRLALDERHSHSRRVRNALALLVPVIYVAKEVVDFDFKAPAALVLGALIAAITALLVGFRRSDLRRQPPAGFAAALRFCGRYSLQIYAASLLVMQLCAYAIAQFEQDYDGNDEAG